MKDNVIEFNSNREPVALYNIEGYTIRATYSEIVNFVLEYVEKFGRQPFGYKVFVNENPNEIFDKLLRKVNEDD